MPFTFLSWEMTIEIEKGHTFLETVDCKMRLDQNFTINKKSTIFALLLCHFVNWTIRGHRELPGWITCLKNFKTPIFKKIWKIPSMRLAIIFIFEISQQIQSLETSKVLAKMGWLNSCQNFFVNWRFEIFWTSDLSMCFTISTNYHMSRW